MAPVVFQKEFMAALMEVTPAGWGPGGSMRGRVFALANPYLWTNIRLQLSLTGRRVEASTPYGPARFDP